MCSSDFAKKVRVQHCAITGPWCCRRVSHRERHANDGCRKPVVRCIVLLKFEVTEPVHLLIQCYCKRWGDTITRTGHKRCDGRSERRRIDVDPEVSEAEGRKGGDIDCCRVAGQVYAQSLERSRNPR